MKAFCKVHGHGVSGVQHVGFRRYITEYAKRLGVNCIAVNNTRDYTVELTLAGDDEKVLQVIDAAKRGSPRARVLKVDCEFWEQGN